MKIAVAGTGLIGRAWAIVFARGGHTVSLFDELPDQAQAAVDWVQHSLAAMAGHGLVSDVAAIAARIGIADDLAGALAGAGYLQESIAERLEPKQAFFAAAEQLAPDDCIFASSSSAIMPSLIFAHLQQPERGLVAHPLNPPHLAPVVEICGSPLTRADVIDVATTLMEGCGMSVVRVEREIEGFILNRLQLAVLNEAFRLIEGGYVSPEGLDKTLKDGLALRWAFMGPVETIDLNAPGGVGDYMQRFGAMIRKVGEAQKVTPNWSDGVTAILERACRARTPQGELSQAQARRDAAMMGIIRHKRDAGL